MSMGVFIDFPGYGACGGSFARGVYFWLHKCDRGEKAKRGVAEAIDESRPKIVEGNVLDL